MTANQDKKQQEMQEKMQQLQQLEHQMQSMVSQKQQMQSQLFELESALGEVQNSPNVYKIIGGIMVAKKQEEIKSELEQKKEVCSLRMKAIEKQEKTMRDKAKDLQEEVVKGMKK